MIKKNFFNFFLILIIFLTDRLSKYLIIESNKINGESEYIMLPYLSFNLIWNEGIAFGLFSFSDRTSYNILTVIIILVTAFIFWMIIKTKKLEKLEWLPPTCAYRLIDEGKKLYDWHHLISGSSKSIHENGMSVRDYAVNENR